MNSEKKQSTKIKKLVSFDAENAENFLRAASLLVAPDDLTQRKTFNRLMPHLYVLRNKGCSWNQLATLLTQIGLNLQISTIKGYYSEILAEKQDICQARMNEQIVLLAQVRKENKGVEITDETRRLINIINKKVDVLPEISRVSEPVAVVTAGEPSVQQPVVTDKTDDAKKDSGRKQKRVPGDFVEDKKEVVDAGFGLLKGSVKSPGVKKPSFFEEPVVTPDVESESGDGEDSIRSVDEPKGVTGKADVTPVNLDSNSGLRCLPLKSGVEPLLRRDANDQSMYQIGYLEHPAIDGLRLSLDERLFGAYLEYVNDVTGETLIETPTEKRFRVMWKKPLKMQESSTSGNFRDMDNSLFKNK